MPQPFRQTYIIGSSDCDPLGHVNVARYFAMCNLTGFAMQTSLGWPPGEGNAGRRFSFAVVNESSEFLSELHAGEEVVVETGISKIGTKSATFYNRIFGSDGRLAFRSAWKSVCLDLETRRAAVIPDDLRTALETVRVAVDEDHVVPK